MKPVINFILLGVFAYILSMAILTQFMYSQTALYFSPIPFIAIVAIFFLTTGTQYKFKMMRAEKELYEQRKNPRYHVDHYPGEVTIPDGTKMRVVLNNVSSGGFQVLCTESSEYMLSHKINTLKKNKSSEIELSAHIPLKERVQQIKANCKMAHISKNKKEIFPVAAGFEVTEFKDRSDETLERLIQELTFAAA